MYVRLSSAISQKKLNDEAKWYCGSEKLLRESQKYKPECHLRDSSTNFLNTYTVEREEVASPQT
jgi:hypothetical protein